MAKENKYTIGLVGFGFINSALAYGFALHVDIKIYDKYNNIYDSLEDTVNSSDFIFIGVPTPMNEDGSQGLSDIYDAVQSVAEVAKSRKIIILRSTIIPGTTRSLATKFNEHTFLFVPEFLTERNSKLDFINMARIIIGSENRAANDLEKLYRTRFTHTPIYHTTWEAAEVVKYMSNSFFAIKVSFLNEMYDIAKHIGVPYEELRDMWLADQRIGNSHTDVPGHDNSRGYGGKCFPKDMQAFIKWAGDNKLNLDMCKAAEKVNERIREVKDWLDIKGATSKNDYKS